LVSIAVTPTIIEIELNKFDDYYHKYYYQLILKKLGFIDVINKNLAEELVEETIKLLKETQISYHQFFADLRSQFNHGWHENHRLILENSEINYSKWEYWQELYHQVLETFVREELEEIEKNLIRYNPLIVPIRPIIESIWQPITNEDNWQPFHELISEINQID